MADSGYAVCFDIGGSAVKAGIVECGLGAIERYLENAGLSTESADVFAAGLPGVALKFAGKIPRESLRGIGISVAGLCRNGIVSEAPNLKWFEAPLATLVSASIREALGTLPVSVENDADCFTAGEWKYGIAKGARSVLGLTLGTGIGGGFILDGRLYHGGQGYGIEPGHTKIPQDMEWPPCGCGGRYCLEAGAGAAGILWTYKKKGGEFPNGADAAWLANAANEGDEIAIRTWRRIGMRLGTGIAGMCNMLNPDAVVLGGGISAARHHFEPMLRSHLETETLVSIRGNAELLFSELGNRANLLGAASALDASN